MEKTLHVSLIGMLSFALVVSSLGCTLWEPTDGLTPSAGPELYLFVQTARAGTLTPVNAASGTYRLTLQSVSPRVLFFSDRPHRDSGTMSLEGYLDEVFLPTEPNPNAALVLQQSGDAGQLTIALELSAPEYNASAGTLSYHVTQLNDVSQGLAHLGFDTLQSLPAQFGNAELFIDSSDWHRCTLELENGLSDLPLYLDTASVAPDINGDRWGTVTKTIPAKGSGTVTFKYHSNTDDKNAKIPFLLGDQFLDKTILINLDCLEGIGSNVNKEKTTCQSVDSTRYKCEFQRFKDAQKTVVYKVSEAF